MKLIKDQNFFHLVSLSALAMVSNGLAMGQSGQGMARGREWGEGSLVLNCLDPVVKLNFCSNSIGEI